MSSEEDDLEEEELLQMALKEQAQRDLNYHRLPSKQTRPMVNLTAPPPPPSIQRGQSNKPQQPARGVAKPRPALEEDEESEVELLSISSEDEDLSRRGSSRFTGGARRAAKDDYSDYGWDADEPDSWKRVDEAELARRVREMRETRAAPAIQARIRKNIAFPRKSITAIDSLPRGAEDFVDPLGLGFFFKVSRGELPPIPEHLSFEAKDFIRRCLKLKPEERSKVSELLHHPFVANDPAVAPPLSPPSQRPHL